MSSSAPPLWLQRVCVLQWVLTFLLGGILGAYLLFNLMWTRLWWLAVLYAIFYAWDRERPERGGRRCQWVREWSMWKIMASYFNARLVKTAELPPDKNYILGFHPHGVLSAGAFLSFSTEATFFSATFPGIKPFLTVLRGHFDFPLYRDYFMLSGAIAANRESMSYVMNRKRFSGNLLALVVGGAPEALDAHEGMYRIHVRDRKGFVKIAMRSGASLVPCLSFGETNYYKQMPNAPGSFVRKVQDFLTSIFGFSPPIFYGFGPLPLPAQITTVVGAPIEVAMNDAPTSEEIEAVQEEYIAALVKLFETHRAEYDPKALDIEIV